MTTIDLPVSGKTSLNALRCAATGAVVFGVIYAGCWAGAALGWQGPSHMFLALFTTAPMASVTALGVGFCWSLVFGAVFGGLSAIAYNALGFLAPR